MAYNCKGFIETCHITSYKYMYVYLVKALLSEFELLGELTLLFISCELTHITWLSNSNNFQQCFPAHHSMDTLYSNDETTLQWPPVCSDQIIFPEGALFNCAQFVQTLNDHIPELNKMIN